MINEIRVAAWTVKGGKPTFRFNKPLTISEDDIV